MLILLLLYVYIFLSTIAIGELMSMFFFEKTIYLHIDLLSLLGFIGLTCCLNILHLFFPLGGFSLHVLMLLFIIWMHKPIFQRIKLLYHAEKLLVLFMPIVSILVVSLIIVSLSPLIGDSMGYHIQILQWFEKYAVVPGLANVHTRLALHSVVFPTMTFFDFSFALGQPLFAVISYFNILLLVRVIYDIHDDFSKKHLGFVLFGVLFTFTNLYFLFCNYLSSPSPDYLASIFVFYIFILLKQKQTGNRSENDILFILVCLFLPFIKLGQILFSVLPIFFIRQKQSWIAYCTIGFAFGVPYLCHNYIQTGYLFYPIGYADWFSPDWKLPLNMPQDSGGEIVSLESLNGWIQSWARVPNVHYKQVLLMPSEDWLPLWIMRKSWTQKVLLLLVVLSPFLSTQLWKKKRLATDWLYLGIVCWASTVFWLLTAPELRFGFGFLCVAAFLPVLSIDVKVIYKINKPFFWSLILTISLIFAHFPALRFIEWRVFDLIFPKKIPIIETIEMDCVNFKIKTPIKKNGCGCEILPCTSYYQAQLEKRGNTFSDGFRLKIKNE